MGGENELRIFGIHFLRVKHFYDFFCQQRMKFGIQLVDNDCKSKLQRIKQITCQIVYLIGTGRLTFKDFEKMLSLYIASAIIHIMGSQRLILPFIFSTSPDISKTQLQFSKEIFYESCFTSHIYTSHRIQIFVIYTRYNNDTIYCTNQTACQYHIKLIAD